MAVDGHPAMTTAPDIYERLFQFACRVIRFCRTLSRTDLGAVVIGRQLAESATSAIANAEESRAAGSARDHIARLRISLKEARESKCRLRICVACEIGAARQAAWPLDESDQLVAILTTMLRRMDPASFVHKHQPAREATPPGKGADG